MQFRYENTDTERDYRFGEEIRKLQKRVGLLERN